MKLNNKKIDFKVEEKLRAQIKKALEDQIIKGSFNYEIQGPLIELLELGHKITKSYLSQTDFFKQYSSIIHNFIKPAKDSTEIRTLKDIITKKALLEIENTLVALIESIPREYTFYFKLSNNDKAEMNFTLSPDLQIKTIKPGDNELDIFTRSSSFIGEVIASGKIEKQFKVGDQIVILKSMGYADSEVDESGVFPVLSILKSLLFLGSIVKIFDHTDIISLWSRSRGADLIFIDKRDPLESKKIYCYNEVGVLVEQFMISTANKYSALAKSDLLKIFSGNLSGVDTSPILAAAEWGFDSWASINETVSFIQVCIGLEAILGDDNKTAVSKVLTERCAFILGKSTQERNRIRAEFKEIYKIRSEIVHGRKVRLDKEGENALLQATYYLKMLLLQEMTNLKI